MDAHDDAEPKHSPPLPTRTLRKWSAYHCRGLPTTSKQVPCTRGTHPSPDVKWVTNAEGFCASIPAPPDSAGLGARVPRRAHSWQGHGQGPSELHVLALDTTLDSLGQGPEIEEESPIKADEADCDQEKGLCLQKGQRGACVEAS